MAKHIHLLLAFRKQFPNKLFGEFLALFATHINCRRCDSDRMDQVEASFQCFVAEPDVSRELIVRVKKSKPEAIQFRIDHV
ncbi:hypothetical protein WQ56_04600 [Luteimonas sp. FCS-9]|nr:hypothetical protein WQ56_04600 [Luteimonas sp. FCS-9]